ncbi:hypothetical protein [Dactylosporangium sp. CA-139066]|uniref:hypothetical protein n=1 Tax=Dactylosporangium sp. CA-139066 TaxID=3239930 RepID=UPI003D93DDBB
MRVREWLRLAVVGLATVHVGGVLVGSPVPGTLSLTLLTLLVYAWNAPGRRIARWARRIGVGAATLAALGAEPGESNRYVWAGLLLLAAAGLTAGWVLRRRPGAYAAAALAVAFVVAVAVVPLASWTTPDRHRDLAAMHRYGDPVWADRYGNLFLDRPGLYSVTQTVDLDAVVAVAVANDRTVAGPGLVYGGQEPDEPVRRAAWTWPPDVWGWRFQWSDIAPAVPPMLVILVLVALAAGRDPEEFAGGRR